MRLMAWREKALSFLKDAHNVTDHYETYLEPLEFLVDESSTFNVHLEEREKLEKAS